MFSIEEFAAKCTDAMAAADDAQQAAAELLRDTVATHGPDALIEALEAAVPAGASVGEMIVHASPALTMLFARVPGRFQSGIHNHTVFACIAPLRGSEMNVSYEQTEDGLRATERVLAEPGMVLQLPADVVHGIENPGTETAYALHLDGGDVGAIEPERSLWDEHTHEEIRFSFPALVQQSVNAMKRADNQEGLDALVEAIPAARAAVESR